MSGRQWTWRWTFLPRDLKTAEMSACPHTSRPLPLQGIHSKADGLLSECYRPLCSVPGWRAGIPSLVVHRKGLNRTNVTLQGQSRGRWFCLADCQEDEASELRWHRQDPEGGEEARWGTWMGSQARVRPSPRPRPFEVNSQNTRHTHTHK